MNEHNRHDRGGVFCSAKHEIFSFLPHYWKLSRRPYWLWSSAFPRVILYPENINPNCEKFRLICMSHRWLLFLHAGKKSWHSYPIIVTAFFLPAVWLANKWTYFPCWPIKDNDSFTDSFADKMSQYAVRFLCLGVDHVTKIIPCPEINQLRPAATGARTMQEQVNCADCIVLSMWLSVWLCGYVVDIAAVLLKQWSELQSCVSLVTVKVG